MTPSWRRASVLALAGLAIAGAAAVGYRAWRASPVEGFASRGTNPRVGFTVTGLDRDGGLVLAVSPYWQAGDAEDAQGIACRRGKDGREYHNVSSVGFQAQGSRSSQPMLDLEALVGGATALTERQERAFRWFDQRKTVLTNGSHLWYYDFEYDYNNLYLTTPWPSAFGQAAVIHALLVAAKTTGSAQWLERAKLAALAFDVDADQGGLRDHLGDLPFYEEVALANGYSPHILNGHLYSCVILADLHRATGDARIGALADAGIATARATLHLFDQGSWTRYDLRPRLHEVPLCFAATEDGVRIRSVALRAPAGGATELRFDSIRDDGKRAFAYGAWRRHDDGSGADVVGPAFCGLALPEPELRDWASNPGWTVEVVFQGDPATPPAVGTLDLRTGIDGGWCELLKLGVEAHGDSQVARFRLGLEDLGWSHLQRYYMEWHHRLVQRLFELTADPVFRRFQARWRGYLDTYDSDIAALPKKDSGSGEATMRLAPRVWDRRTDARLQEGVLQAIAGLGLELKPRDMVLALLRFTFQRLALGANPHSDPGAMLAHGLGSCSHYANVFQALCHEVGLRCRIWNLYEIPQVGGHNLCEVWLEGKWCAMDPGYGAFFTTGADVRSPLASIGELRAAGARAATYWQLAGRDQLPRGRPPAPLPSPDVAAAFLAPDHYPANYPADVIFATRKGGVHGEVTLASSFPVDLRSGRVELGASPPADQGPAWSGLTSLARTDGVIVSLHELGRSHQHTVEHVFPLSGLEPGCVYAFEGDVCHSRQPDPRPMVTVDGAVVWVADPVSAEGSVRRTRAWFRATAGEHELRLSLPRGYALLSALRFFATTWREVPKVVSTGARVVANTGFYPGHGPENALDGVWDDDYVAAQEGTLPNSFTFDVEAPVTALALELVWNATTQYGQDFALFAVGERGEVPVLQVADNRPDAGGRSNRFALASAPATQRFRFEVRRAAGQDRLLLMDLRLVGAAVR